MKAIIDIAPAGTSVKQALALVKGNRAVADPDYHLHYETARLLFADLTPSRVDMLSVLRRIGPCTVYRLAQEAQRHYANVHEDVAVLERLELIDRTEDGMVRTPYDSIQINLAAASAPSAA